MVGTSSYSSLRAVDKMFEKVSRSLQLEQEKRASGTDGGAQAVEGKDLERARPAASFLHMMMYTILHVVIIILYPFVGISRLQNYSGIMITLILNVTQAVIYGLAIIAYTRCKTHH